MIYLDQFETIQYTVTIYDTYFQKILSKSSVVDLLYMSISSRLTFVVIKYGGSRSTITRSIFTFQAIFSVNVYLIIIQINNISQNKTNDGANYFKIKLSLHIFRPGLCLVKPFFFFVS